LSHGWFREGVGRLSGGSALPYARPVPRARRRVSLEEPLEFCGDNAGSARSSPSRLYFKYKGQPAFCTSSTKIDRHGDRRCSRRAPEPCLSLAAIFVYTLSLPNRTTCP
jgi:hypothetical protein